MFYHTSIDIYTQQNGEIKIIRLKFPSTWLDELLRNLDMFSRDRILDRLSHW